MIDRSGGPGAQPARPAPRRAVNWLGDRWRAIGLEGVGTPAWASARRPDTTWPGPRARVVRGRRLFARGLDGRLVLRVGGEHQVAQPVLRHRVCPEVPAAGACFWTPCLQWGTPGVWTPGAGSERSRRNGSTRCRAPRSWSWRWKTPRTKPRSNAVLCRCEVVVAPQRSGSSFPSRRWAPLSAGCVHSRPGRPSRLLEFFSS